MIHRGVRGRLCLCLLVPFAGYVFPLLAFEIGVVLCAKIFNRIGHDVSPTTAGFQISLHRQHVQGPARVRPWTGGHQSRRLDNSE